MKKRNIRSFISFLVIFTMIFTSTGFNFSIAQENEEFQVKENTVEDEVYKNSYKEKVEEDYSVRAMNFFMEEKTVEDDQTKFKRTIGALKNHYDQAKEYDYLTAMAMNRAGVDEKDIQGKLKIDDLKFQVGSGYDVPTSKEYAKAIMGIIAAGLDPTNYNGKNYVDFLVKCQDPKGYFKTKDMSCDTADEVAYSILALNMAGAEYDVDKAMEFLNSKITQEGNKAFVKEWDFASSGDLEKTCMTLIALCSHKDKINDSLINKMVNFIKSEQFNSGLYGDKDSWNKEINSAKKTALVLQALAASKVDIYQDEWKKTQDGKRVSIIDQLFTLQKGDTFKETEASWDKDKNNEATKAVFAALTDLYTQKSMFHEIKIKLGAPHTIKIQVPNDQKQIKIGKTVSLSGRVFDANGKYIASEKLTWSSDAPTIAKIDENGVLTAKGIGKVKVTAKVQGFESIKDFIELEIVDVTPDKLEIKVDGDLLEIEEGRKVKITATAYDTGGDTIENPNIKWSISPDKLAEFKNNIFTAKATGEVSIIASIEDKVTKTITLKIVSRKEKIQKAVDDIQAGLKSGSDPYEYYTVLGLRHIGVDPTTIEDKAKVYGKFYSKSSDYAKNIITAIALGKDPKNYNGKDQIEKILNASKPFYEEMDIANLSDAIIALDMANASYDKEKAIKSLINKVKSSSSLSDKAIAMIALSNHTKIDGANDTIELIKDEFKNAHDENGIIDNCQTTSLVIQGLIAAGEDLYSDPWVKKDENGNDISLLDGLLKLKIGQKFKPTIEASWPKDELGQYGLAALADLLKEKSMYHSIKHGDIEIIKIKEIKIDSKDLSIQKGETKEVKVQAIDEKGQIVGNPNLIWESLNNDTVKVEDGKITGIKKGIGTIRVKAKDDEKIYTDIKVDVSVVYKAPNKVTITKLENTAVVKGSTLKLEVKVFDEDENELENPNLIWSSSKEKIGTIQDGIFTGVQKGSVDILVQVKDTNIKDTISLIVVDTDEEANNTIVQLTEGVKKYYQEIYYRENQGSLEAWECATLARAGIDLTKWGPGAQKKYCTKYDMNLKQISSVIQQVLICIDLGIDPTNFEGRNLVSEVQKHLDNGKQGYASLNELRAVIALDEFNKKYPDKKVNYNVDKALNIIFAAQTDNGGFKQRKEPVATNTGYALKALSNHKGEAGVEESIKKAVQYLKGIQKEDGGFYDKTYITSYHADALSGLLAVGEDITSKEWTKNGKNPIDALFNLWKKNHSFDNKKGESINNKGWIAGTQAALYALVDLKNAGYNNHLVKFGDVEEPVEEPEKTCTVYTAIVVPVGEKYDIRYEAKEVVINNKKHSGLTALGALQATTPIYTMTGNMVTSICGIENQGMSGWMYTINDKAGEVMADQAIVKDGDKILWYYSASMEGKTPKWSEIADQKEEKNMKEEVQKAVDKGSDWLINNFNGDDHWKAIGIARAGKKVPKNYLELLNEGNTLPKKDAGAYGKFILGILSAGGNPEHIGGHNFYQELCKLNLEEDKSAYTLPFGLLALDAIDYKLPKECSFTRDDLIKNLLEKQENGALKLETKYGDQFVFDDGALFILTALSKYSKENQEVKSVVDETFKQLATKQNKDGGFGLGESSVETSAQALMAMSLNGKNPLDESFTKNGENVVEYLLSMQNKDGSFKSIGEDVELPTEQVVYALEQYLYALDKKGSIYDFIKNPVEKVVLEDKNDFKIERIGNETFKNNEEAYVAIKAKNLKESVQEATLIIALYNENNKMVNYSIVSREIQPKEEVNMRGAFLVPETGKYTVKAFIWDNEMNMNSLSRKIVIPVEN